MISVCVEGVCVNFLALEKLIGINQTHRIRCPWGVSQRAEHDWIVTHFERSHSGVLPMPYLCTDSVLEKPHAASSLLPPSLGQTIFTALVASHTYESKKLLSSACSIIRLSLCNQKGLSFNYGNKFVTCTCTFYNDRLCWLKLTTRMQS